MNAKKTTLSIRTSEEIKKMLKEIVEYYENTRNSYSYEMEGIPKDPNKVSLQRNWKTISQSDIVEALIIREYERLEKIPLFQELRM